LDNAAAPLIFGKIQGGIATEKTIGVRPNKNGRR